MADSQSPDVARQGKQIVAADSGASQRSYKAVPPELCAESVMAGVSDGLWVSCTRKEWADQSAQIKSTNRGGLRLFHFLAQFVVRQPVPLSGHLQ
jgi:hypothetical protein